MANQGVLHCGDEHDGYRVPALRQPGLELQSAHSAEMQIEDNLSAGMNPAEARYAALRSFGAIERMKENYRERSAFAFVETVAQDLRYAIRTLRRNPSFSLTSVATLALAIGANSLGHSNHCKWSRAMCDVPAITGLSSGSGGWPSIRRKSHDLLGRPRMTVDADGALRRVWPIADLAMHARDRPSVDGRHEAGERVRRW